MASHDCTDTAAVLGKEVNVFRFAGFALIGLAVSASQARAEEAYGFTQCLSGTFTLFYESKEVPPALGWAETGITMSEDKRFSNVTIHCEGVQFGVGPKREGYGLCKATDLDGDMMIFGGRYVGPGTGDWKFMAGTGKWKGIKGTSLRERIVRSKPGGGAMPATYQVCHRVSGVFDVPPK
jgi:hypothetical protein